VCFDKGFCLILKLNKLRELLGLILSFHFKVNSGQNGDQVVILLHADDGLRLREVPMLKGKKFLPLIQTERCNPLTERLTMTLDEVFGCSQGRVSLDLARRCNIVVDTHPDVVAYRGDLARVGLGGCHRGCMAIGCGGDCGGG
jgi:hypothetical protein